MNGDEQFIQAKLSESTTSESSQSCETKETHTVRTRNPVPYYVPYHGKKLHCHQNEKQGMYECTFYALSDSCSARIKKLFSMPKKNAVIMK